MFGTIHQQHASWLCCHAGQSIPQPLRDRRPLPAGAFDDVEALLAEEAATHYW
jgi:hypothetical protein